MWQVLIFQRVLHGEEITIMNIYCSLNYSSEFILKTFPKFVELSSTKVLTGRDFNRLFNPLVDKHPLWNRLWAGTGVWRIWELCLRSTVPHHPYRQTRSTRQSSGNLSVRWHHLSNEIELKLVVDHALCLVFLSFYFTHRPKVQGFQGVGLKNWFSYSNQF